MILCLSFLMFVSSLVLVAKTASAQEFELNTKGQIEDFIVYTAQRQGVSVDLALGIARCESGLNPLAKAKTSSASGVFQFINSTWAHTTNKLLWEGKQDVFDPRLNIIAGIYLLKTEGATHWECHNLGMT